jgi:hypothetical protein
VVLKAVCEGVGSPRDFSVSAVDPFNKAETPQQNNTNILFIQTLEKGGRRGFCYLPFDHSHDTTIQYCH